MKASSSSSKKSDGKLDLGDLLGRGGRSRSKDGFQPLRQGGNSVGNIWLEFWLEKRPVIPF